MLFLTISSVCSRATLFGQLKIGQLNSASYFMEIRLDIDGLKI